MKCPHCNKDIEYGILDGYAYNDRTFEGVNFEVRYDDNNGFSVKVCDEASSYFEQFNADLFYGMMIEDLENEDHNEELMCPECQDWFLITSEGKTEVEDW